MFKIDCDIVFDFSQSNRISFVFIIKLETRIFGFGLNNNF